jgi:hypothetical protein
VSTSRPITMSQTRHLNTCISLIFLRRIKTAYVLIVDNQLLGIAQNVGKKYPPMRALDSHRRVEAWTSIWAIAARFTLCIYGSYEGLNQIMDLLSGRVPRTVFASHCFMPSLDYKEKVLTALEKLK